MKDQKTIKLTKMAADMLNFSLGETIEEEKTLEVVTGEIFRITTAITSKVALFSRDIKTRKQQ